MTNPPQRPNAPRPQDLEVELQERQRGRDRLKVVGLLILASFILVLAFIRFGAHLPWGAR